MSSTLGPTPAAIEEPSEEPSDVNIFIGCGLAVGGNILISVSLNVQKYAHMKIEDDIEAKHYTRYPIWWLGLILMGLGELGNFTAYGFAPASLVAPLGTTAVIANMFIAVVFLKEKLRADDIFGVTFAVVGAFLLVNFSQKDEAVMDADQLVDSLTEIGFIVYIVIEILALIVLFTMKYRWHIENILVLLLIANLLASFTVICTKGLSGMLQLTIGGNMQLDTLLFWGMLVVLGIMCFLQIKYLNQAMQVFDATIVVPTNFVFFTISAIVAGIIFYKEFWGLQALDIFMFLFGCVMCFIGVYFITAGRAQSDDSETRDILNALRRDGLLKYIPAWLIASESEVRTLSRSNSRQPRTPSTADYAPILRKSGSLSSQSSLNDMEPPTPDRRDAAFTLPPLSATTIQEVPENEANGSLNNNISSDSLPMKTYGTTTNRESGS